MMVMVKFLKLLSTFSVFSLLVPGTLLTVPNAHAQQTSSINRGPSGLPLPRFVSLKSERVNMRVGPGKDYAVSWMYLRAGLPFEIIQEYDNWRRVRDSEGTMGWIHGSLLSGDRTAITTPWSAGSSDKTINVYESPNPGAKEVAYVEPGVLAHVEKCDGVWCELEISSNGKTIHGFTDQAGLWGAYPDEKFEN